jgi:hypothetical protein
MLNGYVLIPFDRYQNAPLFRLVWQLVATGTAAVLLLTTLATVLYHHCTAVGKL